MSTDAQDLENYKAMKENMKKVFLPGYKAKKEKKASMNTQERAYVNGFVKRASEYGYTNEQAIDLLKTASDKLGPFDADRVSEMMAHDMELKAMAYNKKNHPRHYYLNPFVKGPISEALLRLNRRQRAGLADENGLASELMGGGILNAIRGDEKTRGRVRDNFEKHLKDYETA